MVYHLDLGFAWILPSTFLLHTRNFLTSLQSLNLVTFTVECGLEMSLVHGFRSLILGFLIPGEYCRAWLLKHGAHCKRISSLWQKQVNVSKVSPHRLVLWQRHVLFLFQAINVASRSGTAPVYSPSGFVLSELRLFEWCFKGIRANTLWKSWRPKVLLKEWDSLSIYLSRAMVGKVRLCRRMVATTQVTLRRQDRVFTLFTTLSFIYVLHFRTFPIGFNLMSSLPYRVIMVIMCLDSCQKVEWSRRIPGIKNHFLEPI